MSFKTHFGLEIVENKSYTIIAYAGHKYGNHAKVLDDPAASVEAYGAIYCAVSVYTTERNKFDFVGNFYIDESFFIEEWAH